MASAADEDETEHYIICNVCYSEYDPEQRKPKHLPCSHTVCIVCLKVWVFS